jgi:predicted phosphodiesterase
MPAPRIRFFSDLHFGDPTSRLKNLADLAPLLGDADEIVLNGDTLDTIAPETAIHLAAVRAFFASTGRRTTFLSGNHDPDISAHAELSLRDERVWVTHGDVLFDRVAPWSHQAPELARRLDALARDVPPAELARLATRLRHHRLACLNLVDSIDRPHPHPLARAGRLVRTLFPPGRVLAMLRAWRDTPGLAAALARDQRPRARVVLLGHTHYPGVWRPPGTPRITIINTGSFSRPFGGSFVELHDERVRVVRITRRGGAFRPGRVLADFAL